MVIYHQVSTFWRTYNSYVIHIRIIFFPLLSVIQCFRGCIWWCCSIKTSTFVATEILLILFIYLSDTQFGAQQANSIACRRVTNWVYLCCYFFFFFVFSFVCIERAIWFKRRVNSLKHTYSHYNCSLFYFM